MNRQYIGPRYVPKIYGAWAADTSYEALTVVTYNNASYTSKVPVPHIVGSPADNPEYWVCTGEYNAQVVEYANQVSEYHNEVTAVSNDVTNNVKPAISLNKKLIDRKYVLIGDSLGMGYSDEQHEGRGWVYYAMQELGEDNCVYASIVGGGFTEPVPYNWLYQLQNADFGNISDNEVTDVCVFGGSNDIEDTVDNIKTAIGEFCSYCKTRFPNLQRIRIGCFAEIGYSETIRARYITCENFGAEYIGDMENLLHKIGDFDQTRHLHLSQAGYKKLSPYLISCIKYGKCDYTFRYRTTSFTGETGNPHSINVSNLNATFTFRPNERSVKIGGALPADFVKVTCTIDGWYPPNRFDFGPGFLLAQDTSLSCYFPTHPKGEVLTHYNTTSGAEGEVMVWVHERDASEYPDLLYIYLSANAPYQEEGTATVTFQIRGTELTFVN